jgi:UDPglucose 6-dehydrogenase
VRVCVIGTGYVGLVTGVCLAQIGHDVVCIDNNQEKVKIVSGESPGSIKCIKRDNRW